MYKMRGFEKQIVSRLDEVILKLDSFTCYVRKLNRAKMFCSLTHVFPTPCLFQVFLILNKNSHCIEINMVKLMT